MRGKPTLRACPDCNRVDSDELERAAERAQRDLRRMARRTPVPVRATEPGGAGQEKTSGDDDQGDPDADNG